MIVIGGPTAAGKSGVAMALAEALDGEIISADSAQVYRGMDIGTAKPTAEERSRVRHHLVDLVEPGEGYDAGRFVQDADQVIEGLRQRGKVPIVVGGTGMYLRALLHGLLPGLPSDAAVREALWSRAGVEGVAALHEALRHVDPETAARVHHNDGVRVVRALEVYQLTGVTMGEHQRQHNVKARPLRYEATQVIVAPQRASLYERINARVDVMLAQGWVREVERLLARGVDSGCRAMQIMGYRRIVEGVEGRAADDWPETVRLIKRDHRRYAKRQLTWFRAQRGFVWYETGAEAREQIMKGMRQQPD